ncbi:MAG: hypothetical protein FJ100_20425 [Deltaproteobacteria bacterium]|nr:hypothetical protein [Deltaproteobacteria bacterium]
MTETTAETTPDTAIALSPADEQKVADAVAFINRAAAEQGVRLAQTVSDYVVATFFNGDPSGLSSHDRTKTASYYRLARHPNLAMSYASLRRLVLVGLQAKVLPAAVADRLSPTQHRALLAVDDPARKAELAQAALDQGWTAEQLEKAVTEQAQAAPRPVDAPKVGRPPKAEVLKAADGVTKAVARLGDSAAVAAAAGALPPATQAELRATLAAALERLAAAASAVAGSAAA